MSKTNKKCGNFEVESPNIARRHSYPELAVQNELNLNIASIDISDGDLLFFQVICLKLVLMNLRKIEL